MRSKRCGISYMKRVHDINEIYDRYAKQGVSNREIWRRYVYPTYGLSERAFYYVLRASLMPRYNDRIDSTPSLFD
jgi:hypothetical protein